MPLLQGTLTPIERQSTDSLGTAPVRAYVKAHPSVAGRYILGDALSDAAAYLKASPIGSALGRFVLADTAAEESRALYLITPTRVIA